MDVLENGPSSEMTETTSTMDVLENGPSSEMTEITAEREKIAPKRPKDLTKLSKKFKPFKQLNSEMSCQLPTETLPTGQAEACQLPSALMILSSEIITKAEVYKGVKYRRDLLTLGSGNCFYNAISDHNNLNPENKKIDHLSLRAQVCNLVESLNQNPDGSRLSNFIKDYEMLHNRKNDGPFDEWIRKQRKTGTFANELFIHATSAYLKQDIEVVSIKVLIVNEKDILKEVVIVSNYTIESLATPKKESITLGWQSEHFQLLVQSQPIAEACQLLPTTESTTGNVENAKFQCEKCAYSTSALYLLKRHNLTHDGIMNRVCGYCKRTFDSRSAIELHRLECFPKKKDGKFQCEKCAYSTPNLQFIDRHYMTHDGIMDHVCSRCKRTFDSNTAIELHRLECFPKKKDGKFQCEKCAYSTSDLKLFHRHYISHDGIMDHVCSRCKRTFDSRFAIELHRLECFPKKKDGKFQCEKCAYSTPNLKLLDRHYKKEVSGMHKEQYFEEIKKRSDLPLDYSSDE
jgi:hypothetical protein